MIRAFAPATAIALGSQAFILALYDRSVRSTRISGCTTRSRRRETRLRGVHARPPETHRPARRRSSVNFALGPWLLVRHLGSPPSRAPSPHSHGSAHRVTHRRGELCRRHPARLALLQFDGPGLLYHLRGLRRLGHPL